MNEKPEALEVADGVEFCPQPYSYAAARLLREQHAEIERLKADNEALRRDAERLREALKHYGKHDDDCGDHDATTTNPCGTAAAVWMPSSTTP
jgi:hypothetical protein